MRRRGTLAREVDQRPHRCALVPIWEVETSVSPAPGARLLAKGAKGAKRLAGALSSDAGTSSDAPEKPSSGSADPATGPVEKAPAAKAPARAAAKKAPATKAAAGRRGRP